VPGLAADRAEAGRGWPGFALQTAWSREVASRARHGAIPAELEQFGWLLEELRVSLFAQELKTPFPVSAKRLEKVWAQLCR